MSIIPHISSSEQWKKHFSEMSQNGNFTNKRVYTIAKNQIGRGDPVIKMVTPTKVAPDQAKLEVRKKKSKSRLSKKKEMRIKVTNKSKQKQLKFNKRKENTVSFKKKKSKLNLF